MRRARRARVSEQAGTAVETQTATTGRMAIVDAFDLGLSAVMAGDGQAHVGIREMRRIIGGNIREEIRVKIGNDKGIN